MAIAGYKMKSEGGYDTLRVRGRGDLEVPVLRATLVSGRIYTIQAWPVADPDGPGFLTFGDPVVEMTVFSFCGVLDLWSHPCLPSI